MNPYRRRIFDTVGELLAPLPSVGTALDFGSGDGWFAKTMLDAGLAANVTPIDVQLRPQCHVTPILYDGGRLPFDDRSFDLVYSFDVLHHCPEPKASLKELLRCTGRYLLLKDHTYTSRLGWLTLCALDEIGNRRFGVPSIYRYQQGWEWTKLIEAEGFTRERFVYPARCHTGLLGWTTNRLQFIGLWRREG